MDRNDWQEQERQAPAWKAADSPLRSWYHAQPEEYREELLSEARDADQLAALLQGSATEDGVPFGLLELCAVAEELWRAAREQDERLNESADASSLMHTPESCARTYRIRVTHTLDDGHPTHPEAVIEVQAEDERAAYVKVEGLLIAGGDAADWDVGKALPVVPPVGLMQWLREATVEFERQCERGEGADQAWHIAKNLSDLLRESEPSTAEAQVVEALRHLAEARELLKKAGASRSVERVRLAISSAKGARRHAEHRPYVEARRSAKAGV